MRLLPDAELVHIPCFLEQNSLYSLRRNCCAATFLVSEIDDHLRNRDLNPTIGKGIRIQPRTFPQRLTLVEG